MAIDTDIALEPHFDPNEFARAIRSHGHKARIRKVRKCPCADRVTQQPNAACQSCENGMLWDAGVEEDVLVPGRRRGDVYDPIGLYLSGMVMFSFAPGRVPGHLDRIDLLEAQMAVTQELLVVGDGKERLRVRPVLNVEFLDIWDDANKVAVPLIADSIADPLPILPDGDTGQLVWAPGGPVNGTPYTVRYITRPAFIVLSDQPRDEGHTTMPYRAIAQRLDFYQSRGK